MSRIVADWSAPAWWKRGKNRRRRRVRLDASAKGTKILQEGATASRVLAKAVYALSDKEQNLLGQLVELLQRVIRSL